MPQICIIIIIFKPVQGSFRQSSLCVDSFPRCFIEAVINQAVFTQSMQPQWQCGSQHLSAIYLRCLNTSLVCSVPNRICNAVRASVHACSYSSKASSWPQRASGFSATGQPWFRRHTAGNSINSSPSLTGGSVSSEYTSSVCILPQSSSICIITCHLTGCQTVDSQSICYFLHSMCDTGARFYWYEIARTCSCQQTQSVNCEISQGALLTDHLCLIVVGQSPL